MDSLVQIPHVSSPFEERFKAVREVSKISRAIRMGRGSQVNSLLNSLNGFLNVSQFSSPAEKTLKLSPQVIQPIRSVSVGFRSHVQGTSAEPDSLFEILNVSHMIVQ